MKKKGLWKGGLCLAAAAVTAMMFAVPAAATVAGSAETGSVQLQPGWAQIGDKWQYVNENGEFVTGWLQIDGTWYFLNDVATMVTGVVNIDGKDYYFGADGAMQTGPVYLYGRTYEFAFSGELVKGGVLPPSSEMYIIVDGVVIRIQKPKMDRDRGGSSSSSSADGSVSDDSGSTTPSGEPDAPTEAAPTTY